jgi:hypothetical protein
MKFKRFYILALAVPLIILSGCKKDDPSPSTTIEIRLIDESGNSVSGATVKLYKSQADIENQENQLGSTLTSDTGGKVTFSNLESLPYYWLAEKGCQNNVNGIMTTDALESGKTRIITSTLISTGNLELTNQSLDQYQVYINGYLLLTADAGFVYNYIYVPVGSYEIRVLKVGGAVDKTYNGTITCGNTLSITFP